MVDSLGTSVSSQVSKPLHKPGTIVDIMGTAVRSEKGKWMELPSPGTIVDAQGLPVSSKVSENI